MTKRKVFIISDRTGITAEAMCHSLLTQFTEVEFDQEICPYIDNEIKAQEVVVQINQSCEHSGQKAIVFVTTVAPAIQDIIARSDGLVMDFFKMFIAPMEQELGVTSSYQVGQSHGISSGNNYYNRIEAVNFALSCDDGVGVQHYDKAAVILVGVSRCGKTPASLYLAMQFGIFVANYPFIPDDMEHLSLPSCLKPHKNKLFGLTITGDRLHAIREERRPDSRYASNKQCNFEIKEVEDLFLRERIPYINTTERSVEEISTKILVKLGLKRHAF